jgi:hypothetical protein
VNGPRLYPLFRRATRPAPLLVRFADEALADKQAVPTSSETPTRRIESLTTHVDAELAAAVRQLAAAEDRTVSRQVAIAVREHVQIARASDLSRAETPESAAGPQARPGVDSTRAPESFLHIRSAMRLATRRAPGALKELPTRHGSAG